MKSSRIYFVIPKILPVMIGLVAAVKCYTSVVCPLKNSLYWKVFYRHHQLTSDDIIDVSERDSHASKARCFRGKETETFHIAGGMPAPIRCGGKPNQIGTLISTKYLILTRNDLPSWARRHAALLTGAWSFPKALAYKAIAA